MKNFSVLSVIILMASISYAQSTQRTVVNSGGQGVEKNGIKANYTIGQSRIGSVQTGLSFVSQGYQHADIYEEIVLGSQEEGGKVSIFPNPVASSITIETGELDIVEIEVIDVTGNSVLFINSGFKTVDLSALKPGDYHLVLKSREGEFSTGFVKY